jgi:hypothetical protein
MANLWDAVLREGAEAFVRSLPEEEEVECRSVILNDLCDNPLPENNLSRYAVSSFPNQLGTIECFIKGWHFRYGIENENTIVVFTVNYDPDNPKSPLFGLFPNVPRPPDVI